MSSCHHAVKKKGDMRSQRNSIYNINIIYTISLSPYTAFSSKILNGMMTLRHDDITTRLYDALQIDVALVGCFVDPRREAQGWHPVFWGKLQRILFKSPPPFRRILTKDSSKTFTKLSLTFTKLSPKGPKRGEKVDFFLFFFLQLSPDPQKFVGHERIPYLCTVS